MAVAGKDLLETEKREKGKLRQNRAFFVLLEQILSKKKLKVKI